MRPALPKLTRCEVTEGDTPVIGVTLATQPHLSSAPGGMAWWSVIFTPGHPR